MWTFLRPYKKGIILSLLLMSVELIVELWHPLLMKTIIDEGVVKRDLSAVLWWGGLMVAVAFVGFAAGITNSFFSARVSQYAGYDIRSALFQRIQTFSAAAYNRFPASALITRITSDVNQLQNVIFMGLRIAPRAPLMMVGSLIMALLIDVRIAGVLLIAVPLCLCVLVWMMKRGFTLFRAVQNQLDATNGIVRENLIGMRLIKAFVRYRQEIRRFSEHNQALMDRTVSALRLIELTIPLLLLLMNICVLVILWFGNWELTGTNAGDVVAIVIYATRITAIFSMLSWILMGIARAKASAGRVNEVLRAEDPGDAVVHQDQDGASDTACDTASASDVASASEERSTAQEDDAHAAHKSSKKGSLIEFDDVDFRYPGTSEPVLRSVSFIVRPGQTVAVMGATGAGKSSLFQLLPRLYDPENGVIYLDGVDIRTLPVEQLRAQIGMVPQEVILFSGSITDNIRWGAEDATMDEVMEAANHAQIHEAVMSLPRGYETVVGQKGVNLSGGQKQRLSIARALVRRPKLLLLDDSTSALDLRTEARLLAALRNYSCTTLIITQKVSTAIHADSILLLSQGRIMAQGNHTELLESSELYRQIVKSQFGDKAVNEG